MAKNVEHVSHIKSKLKTNGLPQLPTADKLVDGEIAINYAEGVETISIRNENSAITTFSSDNYYTEKKLGSGFTNNDATVTEAIDDLEYMVVNKEEAIAAALNDLNGRKLDASAYTPTDLSNYYTKDETSGKTEISNALGGKVNTATFTGHTADTSLHFSGNEKINLDALATNIESISGITSNDIANWNAAAGVDMSKYYKKTETSGSTELTTAFSNKADSSALTTHTSDTTIHITSAERTAWNAKADISDIPSVNGYADSVQYNSTTKNVEFYHGTTAGTKVFEYDASPFLIDGMVQNVEIKDVQSGDPAVTVTCLVVSFNTDAGKQDINIPISQIFDANNYYTTAQTSGATELQTAFNGKTDTATTTALDNVVTAHTANTNIHLTTTEKGQLHTHTNKTYLDSITGTVGTMVYENASSYSSATQVSTALADKVDKTEYATFSAATNTSIEDLSGQSETVAAALNDLNAKKLDTTAYTPVDTSLYYKKTETSGATEIQTALNSKVDTTAFTNHTSSSVHMTTTEKTNLDSLATNIAAISGITATKVSNWDDANTKKHTHSNKTALDSITGNVGTMAYEDNTSYSSATEVNTALSNKADKTAVDDLSGQSETIAAALNDLNGRVNEKASQDDLNTVLDDIELITKDVEDLTKTVVMSITTTDARGYGESTPTLAQYTGNKSNLNGILSHFKLGWFDSGGTLVKECAPGRISAARDGSEIAIDGTNGDLMVYIDTDIYRDRATVNGLNVQDSTATTHNVIGLGLAPHQLGGKTAKKFEPFGFTPHCAKYSNSKGYSYYDGGNVQCSINSLTSSVNALNKGGGYMGLYYEFYEIWLIAMYMELGTLDYTNDTYFGNGCTNYTPTASNWLKGGSGCMYTGNTYGSFWSNTVSSYNFAEMLEAQRIMDGVVKARLTDSIGSTSVMTYNDSGDVVTVNNINLATWDGASAMTQDKKYFTIQNVTNCQGLGDGVMTGIVNIFVKGTDRIRKYSHPIYRGLDLLSGFFVQLEGLHYVVKHTGTTASLAQSQELFYAQSWKEVPTSTSVYTNANSIVSATTEEGLTDNPVLVSTYTSAGSYPTGSDGWGKETDYNVSLFAHKVIGGAQHTYECGHIWYRGTSWSSPAGTNSSGYLTSNAKSANASVVGCSAGGAHAGRTLAAISSVASSNGASAGGFAHPQIKVR